MIINSYVLLKNIYGKSAKSASWSCAVNAPPFTVSLCAKLWGFPSSSSSSPSLSPLHPPEEVDGATAALSGIQSPLFLPPGEHHLRPPVSHCSPAGSCEPFSTQMSANKDMHVRERGKKEQGTGRRRPLVCLVNSEKAEGSSYMGREEEGKGKWRRGNTRRRTEGNRTLIWLSRKPVKSWVKEIAGASMSQSAVGLITKEGDGTPGTKQTHMYTQTHSWSCA